MDLLLAELAPYPDAKKLLLKVVKEEIARVRGRKDLASKTIDHLIKDLQAKVDRLGKAIELGQGNMETLVERLKPLTKELKEAKQQCEWQVFEQTDTPDVATLDIDPREILLKLAKVSFEFADLVRKILPECKIQPVQALDSGLVRPRAFLTVNLAALAPVKSERQESALSAPKTVVCDLFEPPVHIKHLSAVVSLLEAKNLARAKVSLSILAAELKIGRMTVKRALKYHRLMLAEGLVEPYRVLNAPPAMASRWKPRSRKDAA